jgi:hypothetical protein
MSDAYVADARRWAGALVAKEYRGPGDMDGALWRAAQKWGVDHSTFWSLRYRPPKDIVVGVYMRLKAAYESEVERQEARLAHELMLAKAAGLDAIIALWWLRLKLFLARKKAVPNDPARELRQPSDSIRRRRP